MSPTSSSSDNQNKSSLSLIGAILFLVISIAIALFAITGFDLASLTTPPAPDVAQGVPSTTPLPGLPEPVAAQPTVLVPVAVPRWTIQLIPLTADAPDVGGALADAISAALQESSVPVSDVRLERASPSADISQAADLLSLTQNAPPGLLVAWEAADDQSLRIYLIDSARPPVTTIDEPLQAWTISAPGKTPIIANPGGDMRLPAGLITGILELAAGDFERAANRFSALQALPSDIPVEAQANNQAAMLFALGQAQAAQGATSNALESFSQALRLRPDFPAATMDRGALYQSFGDNTAALTVFQAGVDDPFTQRPALHNLAVTTASMGDTASALKAASDLIDILPNSAEALNLRGVIAYQSGDSRAALADFIAASALTPETESQPVLLNLAAAYMAEAQYPEAIATYDSLIRLAPEDASLHLRQGQVFTALGDADKATQSFDRAIAIDNGYADAYVARAQLEFRQGKLNQAITDANQALTIDPDAGLAYRVLADSWLAQEDFKLAEANYTAALEHGIEDADHYAGRGWARQRLFKNAGAIRDYEQAIALGATDSTLLLRLGFATYNAGRHEESLNYFRQALATGLDTAEAHAGLAIALDANLKRSEANDEYQKALALDNQFAEREFLQSQPLWSSSAIGRAMSIVKRLP